MYIHMQNKEDEEKKAVTVNPTSYLRQQMPTCQQIFANTLET